MSKQHNKLNVGDSVVVKSGVKDPDIGCDIGGWQGRISALEGLKSDDIVEISWDSLTLNNMPLVMIKYCEKEGLDWEVMNLGAQDIEQAIARDKKSDVENTLKELRKHTAWLLKEMYANVCIPYLFAL